MAPEVAGSAPMVTASKSREKVKRVSMWPGSEKADGVALLEAHGEAARLGVVLAEPGYRELESVVGERAIVGNDRHTIDAEAARLDRRRHADLVGESGKGDENCGGGERRFQHVLGLQCPRQTRRGFPR